MRAFRLAYDGRSFHGFQRQPDVPTVEDALFDALRTLGICDDQPASYSAAGRTDAGVSAIAQTVAFDCPDWCTPRALNPELPRSVWAWAATDVPGDFHAGLAARRREYTYHLHAPGADDDRARETIGRLSDEHDFHNLTTDDEGTVRTLEIDLTRDGSYLVVTVAADGFPRQLVRRLITLIRSCATAEADHQLVDRVLAAAPLEGPAGIGPAPADPLVLTAVDYDRDFTADETARDDAIGWFDDRRIEWATRSRVAGFVCDRIA